MREFLEDHWIAIVFVLLNGVGFVWAINEGERVRTQKQKFCYAKMQTFEDFERCTK